MTAALLRLNARTFASLQKHRNYRLFFAGQIVSLAGTWMQNIALAWLVWDMTRDPVAVGGLAFCRFVPFSIFGLYAGVIADRFNIRKLVIGTQSFAMVVSVALAALTLSGAAEIWSVYALAFLGGVALVLDAPCRHALTFQMVGRDELPNAIALNTGLFNASRVVGPAIAGVLIAAVGVGICFAINAVSFLAVLAALIAMRAADLVPVERAERNGVLNEIREGLGYARRSPRIRFVLLATAVISTVGFNFHVILPLLSSDTLNAGPRTFGALSAVFGGGALVGALASAALGRASMKAMLGGTIGFSLSLLALAPLTNVYACAVLLFITGISFTLWTSNSNALIQLNAPDELRGRVVSLWLFAFAGLAPLGGLLAGWLVELGGTRLAFLVAGGVGLAMAIPGVRQVTGTPRAEPAHAGAAPS